MKSTKLKRKLIKSIININVLAKYFKKYRLKNVKAIRKIMFYDKHMIQTTKQKQAITV